MKKALLIPIMLLVSVGLKAGLDEESEILLNAAFTGSLAGVSAALQRGANVNAKDNFGQTVLVNAIRGVSRDRIHIVKKLIAAKADVNAKDESGRTVLMFACRYGPLSIVKVLLEAGADRNAKDNLGRTVLMETAIGGHVDIASKLLGFTSSFSKVQTMVRIKDKLGYKAFDLAVAYNNSEVATFLRDF